jgi:hypothetical protein
MRTALTVAGCALVLGGLVGCGDDGGDSGTSGMPTNATSADFCANFKTLREELSSLDPSAEPSDAVSTLQDAADLIQETGTPENIPDNARAGLEATLTAIGELDPEDASPDEIGNLEDSFNEQEKGQADAFDEYLAGECELS